MRLFNHGEHEGFLRNPSDGSKSQMFVDLGVYGIPPEADAGRFDAVSTARVFERFVRDKGGYQMLYAEIFMTRLEFGQMFELGLYRKMRAKHRATEAFPEVYDKVIPEKWLIDLEALPLEHEV